MAVTTKGVKRTGGGTARPVMVLFDQLGAGAKDALPELPDKLGTPRDRILRFNTLRAEPIWAGAVSTAITKGASLSWEILGGRYKKQAHAMLHNADGGGWQGGYVAWIQRVLADYFLTDKGAFIEVQWRGAMPHALWHLESTRVELTGDTRIPITYTDKNGGKHDLKWNEVIRLVDMPFDLEDSNGYGLCAASRAYETIQTMAAIRRHLRSKVSGEQPKEIHIVNGINGSEFDDAEAMAQAKGAGREDVGVKMVSYKGGVLVIPTLAGKPDGYRIPLAEVPEGYDIEKEREAAYIEYALALGVDPQDIRPNTGNALGQGAQSRVLDDKDKGRKLAMFRQQLTHAINRMALPRNLQFKFYEDDMADREREANLRKSYFDMAQVAIATQMMDAATASGWLNYEDVIPDEFIAAQQVDDGAATDETGPTVKSEGRRVKGETHPKLVEPPPVKANAARKKDAARLARKSAKKARALFEVVSRA